MVLRRYEIPTLEKVFMVKSEKKVKREWLIYFFLVLLALAALGFFYFRSRKAREPYGQVSGEKMMNIRKPAVAGTFYEADPDTLSRRIDDFLKEATPSGIPGNLRILVVPHAGHLFSGPVAAYGFKEILGRDFERIIILGPSHQAYFEEIAIDDSDSWETPLGQVELDHDFIENLLSESPKIVRYSPIHADEHCLEVEIPFLQKTLEDFKIVPILLGSKSEDTINTLADALSRYIDSRTLLLVSTDLSHYPRYDDANLVDKKTVDAVLSGDTSELDAVISESMSQGISNLATCMCGEVAVRVAMKLAPQLEATDIRLLKYANSGDTAGDKTRVVGYAAVGFYAPSEAEVAGYETETLGIEEQRELLDIARRTLEGFVHEGKVLDVQVSNPALNEPCGAFVTLRKDGKLRGCMGVFEPEEPLWKVIQDRTVASASKDPRFVPVAPKELSEIEIEISVLSKPKRIDDPKEIELGKHGVIIRNGSRGGVFLPQVATETGWDFETFMGQLCSQKAGLPWNCWKDLRTELHTFTAQVFP